MQSHRKSTPPSAKGAPRRAPELPNSRSLMIILGIMAALFVWGTLHAAGAYLYNLDMRKPFVVYAFVGGFLAFWGVAVMLRNRRLRREFERLPDSDVDDQHADGANG